MYNMTAWNEAVTVWSHLKLSGARTGVKNVKETLIDTLRPLLNTPSQLPYAFGQVQSDPGKVVIVSDETKQSARGQR